MDMQPRIEAVVEDIVNTAVSIGVAGHTLFGELVSLSHGTKGYHTARRNLRLDYFDAHNWRK